MKAIKDRRNLYAALSAAVLLITALLAATQRLEAALVCGGLTAGALILLYRQSRLLDAALVICDSRILTVPSSVITQENRPNLKQAEETIVSTFGLLLGSEVYKWGCEGVHGVRLREVHIDREHIRLAFGADGEMLRVELLHGLADGQSIADIAQKIWRETGIRAEISDW